MPCSRTPGHHPSRSSLICPGSVWSHNVQAAHGHKMCGRPSLAALSPYRGEIINDQHLAGVGSLLEDGPKVVTIIEDSHLATRMVRLANSCACMHACRQSCALVGICLRARFQKHPALPSPPSSPCLWLSPPGKPGLFGRRDCRVPETATSIERAILGAQVVRSQQAAPILSARTNSHCRTLSPRREVTMG